MCVAPIQGQGPQPGSRAGGRLNLKVQSSLLKLAPLSSPEARILWYFLCQVPALAWWFVTCPVPLLPPPPLGRWGGHVTHPDFHKSTALLTLLTPLQLWEFTLLIAWCQQISLHLPPHSEQWGLKLGTNGGEARG